MDALTPRQLEKEGMKVYQERDYARASSLFCSAAEGYSLSGNEPAAAEMLNNACVAYLQMGDNDAALAAVEGTPEIFATEGDASREGMAYGNLGAALDALDRPEDALAAYQRSVDVLKDTEDHDLRARVLQSLSALQLRTGKQLESLATMQAGLGEIEKPNAKEKFLKKLLRIPFDLLGRS